MDFAYIWEEERLLAGVSPAWAVKKGKGIVMDYRLNGKMPAVPNRYGSVTGTIVDLIPTRQGNGRTDGCVTFVEMEDMDGNTVHFVLTPVTYVVDFETLSAGMTCTFWYEADAPMPLVYPPRYNAVVAAQEKNGRMVNVGFYNRSLINESNTLQLNLDQTVEVRTTNNQYFQGSPANHNLVVVYGNSTRSIPAQTTPMKVVVLCE